MFKKILVPVDGSEHAFKTLDLACDLAEKYGAGLYILHVVPARMIPESVRRFAEVEYIEEPPRWIYEQVLGKHILGESEEHAKRKGVQSVRATIHEGNPSKVIVDAANAEGVDAIVMGSRGLSDLEGLVMGSVAHKVGQLADCTVITVK